MALYKFDFMLCYVTRPRGHVTLKGQARDPNTLIAQYLENSCRDAVYTTIANY